QFRLKYPNTRLKLPSAFCSHPSKTGTTSCPVALTCARVRATPANDATRTRTLQAATRRQDIRLRDLMIRPSLRLTSARHTRGHFVVPAQRTAKHRLSVLDVKHFAAVGHLLLQFVVAQNEHLSDVDHHVVDRTMAQARPVSRIDHVSI